MQGALLAVLLFSLVAVELVGAQAKTRADRNHLLTAHGAIRQLRQDGHGRGTRLKLAGRHAAEFEEIVALQARGLPRADHDQPLDLHAFRGENVEGRRFCL